MVVIFFLGLSVLRPISRVVPFIFVVTNPQPGFKITYLMQIMFLINKTLLDIFETSDIAYVT